jgi:hypothetical protein
MHTARMAGYSQHGNPAGPGGYSHAAVLEVVAQVGCTTLTNLTHNISDAPARRSL